MNVRGLAICPPPGASGNPAVTPELLASCLARYSRSNKGIGTILDSIDWSDPDKAVDAIFRFVDYGHASITGLTGGIAMVVDGCSMFLAYKIFEIAQLCDGQESSTRYIKLDRSSLPDPQLLGIPSELQGTWSDLMGRAFDVYHSIYESLDEQARANPSIVRVPPGATEKVIDRLRKNYALDRARYFIPFATKTNAAYVMTARVWADTIRQLDALPLLEARECAALLRAELEKFTPHMIRHSMADQATCCQAQQLIEYAIGRIRARGMGVTCLADKVFVGIENQIPAFLPSVQSMSEAFEGKVNRYSAVGTPVKRMFVRAAWNNMALAELRDLNRHRSGFRFSPLTPVGFYAPPEADHPDSAALLHDIAAFVKRLANWPDAAPGYVYGLLLGTQVPFEHSTHADKMIYEIELRTGMGAHFRYAEHLHAIYRELIAQAPELAPHIQVGNAEPE